MIPIPSGVRVWLATGHTDMRCGFPSLALRVQEVLKHDPLGGHLFCFRGKRGDLVKIVWHDGQGACLFTKNWNEEGSFGLLPKVARWQSRRHSFPTCSPELIGARLRKLGDQREYDCI